MTRDRFYGDRPGRSHSSEIPREAANVNATAEDGWTITGNSFHGNPPAGFANWEKYFEDAIARKHLSGLNIRDAKHVCSPTEVEQLRTENRLLREAAERAVLGHTRIALQEPLRRALEGPPLTLMYECRDALALHDQHNELYLKVWKWCQERQQKGPTN